MSSPPDDPPIDWEAPDWAQTSDRDDNHSSTSPEPPSGTPNNRIPTPPPPPPTRIPSPREYGQPRIFSDAEAEEVLEELANNPSIKRACCKCKKPQEGEVEVEVEGPRHDDDIPPPRRGCSNSNCESVLRGPYMMPAGCNDCWHPLPTHAQLLLWGFRYEGPTS
jgi:hypothetical protein